MSRWWHVTILRYPPKENGEGAPRPIFFSIISLSDPADVAKLLRSDPKHTERLDFPSLNFYREKRKKIPDGFFCRWRMVQATERPEQKNAWTERSRRLYSGFQ